MPAAKSSQSSVATTGDAQSRFTMQLPAEVGKQLDAIGARMAKAAEEVAGVAIEFSRPDVVRSLITRENRTHAEREASATAAKQDTTTTDAA